MAHHFIRILDLTTGIVRVREFSAADFVQRYAAAWRALLAEGKPVRIFDEVHLDMGAFVDANLHLPWAMTRQPINLAARRAGVPQLGA